jgi:hypothetical protein
VDRVAEWSRNHIVTTCSALIIMWSILETTRRRTELSHFALALALTAAPSDVDKATKHDGMNSDVVNAIESRLRVQSEANCGPNAVLAAAKFLGCETRETDVQSVLPSSTNPTSLAAIERALLDLGLSTRAVV